MLYNKKIFKRCFHYRKRYWYLNLKNIPLYFKLMHHLVKHGYDEYANWETFNWFIDTMKEILLNYKNNKQGIPILLEDYPLNSFVKDEESLRTIEQNEKLWEYTINRMIELLELMDNCSPIYENCDYKEIDEKMHKAKDEFFELFSKYFYNLWD